ncbi:MAG: 3-phosphoshikimate 1-carboxyvinyltransferase [Flavobacteriales bacterium]
MKKDVYPSILTGTIKAPGSKSIAQRMVAGALLAKGESFIADYPESADCQAALQVAQQLGAVITTNQNDITIKGGFPQNFQNGIRNPKDQIFCGESGLASRMFTPIAALYHEEILVEGEGSLLLRPFTEFDQVIPALGAKCKTKKGKLPVKVHGPLQGGKADLDGSLSSQFLTGLLMALPRADHESLLNVSNLKSIPYVRMTIEVMKMFGVETSNEQFEKFKIAPNQTYIPIKADVPGDWSGAAFLLVAGAVAAENGILVTNLSFDITQADSKILDALKLAGVSFEIKKEGIFIRESEIQAFEFDASDCPDLMPPLAALAAFANGVSVLKGAKRLKHKESNRSKALKEEFGKAGIKITVRDDEMLIYPGHIRSAQLNSHNDHRIAMAAAILGLGGDKITINGSSCVSKSYPSFFEDLTALNAKIASK